MNDVIDTSYKAKLLSYYEKAGPDYSHWSKNYNMHFGYYAMGMNPFNRRAMLENMSRKVLDKLAIVDDPTAILVDLGCGLGATLRSARKRYSCLHLHGITIVPWQVEQATHLNAHHPDTQSISIVEGDYCHTHYPDNSVDRILAIESSCYAPGSSKKPLLQEIHRILKPGGRFVIVDGFRKSDRPLRGILKKAYRSLCQSWVLEQLGNIQRVERYLKHLNFSQIEVKEMSWNVAPSVAHVPFTVLTFLIKQFMMGRNKMNAERWNNLKSPLLTMIVGLARKDFGYYMISVKN